MKNTCYHCTHADFRAEHQDQKSGKETVFRKYGQGVAIWLR